MIDINYKNLIQIHNKAMVDCSDKYKFDQCLNAILTKFYSNLGVYNTLYWELKHYNEARIIARSAIESVLLFSFLITHPDKIQEYYDESMLLQFRNSFIEMKELKTELSKMLFDNSVLQEYEESYKKQNLELFKLLSITRQKDILKTLCIDEYMFNDNTFNKLDKYLSRFRPKSQKFNDFFGFIDALPNMQIRLKEFLFLHYNVYSQICHSSLYKCIDNTRKIDILKDFSLFKRLLYTVIMICDYAKMPIDINHRTLIDNEIKNLNIKMNSLICTK